MISKEIKTEAGTYRRPGKVEEWIKDTFYWPVRSFFSRNYRMICRMAAYAWFVRDNHDWDQGYLFALMEFKLRRMKKELIEGVAYQDEKDMNALEEAANICARLGNDHDYDEKYMDAIDLKYGAYDFTNGFFPAERPNVNDSNKAEYVKALMDSDKLAHKDWKNDLNRLNQILKLHSKTWWD